MFEEFIERYFGKDVKDDENIEHFSQKRMKQKKSKSSGWGWILILLVIIALVLIIYVGTKIDRGSPSQPPAPRGSLGVTNAPAGPGATLPAPARGGWRGKKWGKTW